MGYFLGGKIVLVLCCGVYFCQIKKNCVVVIFRTHIVNAWSTALIPPLSDGL